MRKTLSLALWVGLLAMRLPAGTVSYDFSVLPLAPPADAPPGSATLRFTYLLSGFTFQANEELDIEFDPAYYGAMSNPQAAPGFLLNLFQPNDPPGATGDFSLLATANNPSFQGTFGADVVFFGPGLPGPLPFTVNQFDQQGNFVSVVSSGFATSSGDTSVPEPGSFWLGGLGFLICAGWWAIRHRSRSAV